MKTERLDMRVDPETKQRLVKLSEQFDMPISQIVRMLIHATDFVSIPIVGTISSKGINVQEELDRR